MRPYPFAIRDHVRGADCRGGPISARVVELVSPYSVLLSDGYVTPISLLQVPPERLPWEPKEKLPWES